MPSWKNKVNLLGYFLGNGITAYNATSIFPLAKIVKKKLGNTHF